VPQWVNSQPGVVSCAVAADGKSAVLQPIAPGDSLITVSCAGCPSVSYINVRVGTPQLKSVDIVENPA
jgi:hypothetical protein